MHVKRAWREDLGGKYDAVLLLYLQIYRLRLLSLAVRIEYTYCFEYCRKLTNREPTKLIEELGTSGSALQFVDILELPAFVQMKAS